MKKREEEGERERDGGCPLGRTWARGDMSVPRVHAQAAGLPSEETHLSTLVGCLALGVSRQHPVF